MTEAYLIVHHAGYRAVFLDGGMAHAYAERMQGALYALHRGQAGALHGDAWLVEGERGGANAVFTDRAIALHYAAASRGILWPLLRGVATPPDINIDALWSSTRGES